MSLLATLLIWMFFVNLVEYVIKAKEDYDLNFKINWKEKVI